SWIGRGTPWCYSESLRPCRAHAYGDSSFRTTIVTTFPGAKTTFCMVESPMNEAARGYSKAICRATCSRMWGRLTKRKLEYTKESIRQACARLRPRAGMRGVPPAVGGPPGRGRTRLRGDSGHVHLAPVRPLAP